MRIRIIVLCLSLAAGPAWAHAFLQHADPGAGAELNAAPKQLALTFSEKLEPNFSGVSVTDAQGHDVEENPAIVSGADMTVALKPLAEGSYHVAWRAVSVDSHRTEGSYNFTVKP
jgi:copper resistance protein C